MGAMIVEFMSYFKSFMIRLEYIIIIFIGLGLVSCDPGTNIEVLYTGDRNVTTVRATKIEIANKVFVEEAIKNAWFQTPGKTTPKTVGFVKFGKMLRGKGLYLDTTTGRSATGRLPKGLWVISIITDDVHYCNAKVVEIPLPGELQRIDLRR